MTALTLALTLGLGAASAPAAPVLAQHGPAALPVLRDLHAALPFVAGRVDQRLSGRGDFRAPGRNVRLTSVRVRLNDDRTFTLDLSDGTEITGTWRREDDDTASLSVRRVSRIAGATGVGTVRLRRDRVVGVSASGRAPGGGWNLNLGDTDGGFGGSGGTWPNRPQPPIWPDRPNEDSDYLGEFRYDVRGELLDVDERYNLTSARSRFDRNGRFWVEVSPRGHRVRIEGDYHRTSGGSLSLDITRFNTTRSRGSGSVQLDRNQSIERIQLRGVTDRDLRFGLDFKRTGPPRR